MAKSPRPTSVEERRAFTQQVRCRICGRWFKILHVRHLGTQHGLTRSQYAKRFGLRFDELIAETTRWSRATRPDYHSYSFAELRQKLFEIHSEEGSLQEVKCKRKYPALVDQVIWLYGSWYAGVEAIGVDPKEIRNYKTWSKERVLREIRRRNDKGLDLAGARFKKTQFNLIEAARRHFGSYRAALAAAGISESEIGMYPRWRKDRVLRELREIGEKQGHKKVDSELLSAAQRYFGNLHNAVQAAGFDETTFFGKTLWSKKKVLEKIRALARSGEPANSGNISHKYSGLYSAGVDHFGSWDDLLKAAGLDPKKIRLVRPRRSNEEIIRELRRIHASGDPLFHTDFARRYPKIFHATVDRFGSFRRAKIAAGISIAVKPRSDLWTEERIISTIKSLRAKNPRAKLPSSAVGAAQRIFGSLRRAMEVAGVTPVLRLWSRLNRRSGRQQWV